MVWKCFAIVVYGSILVAQLLSGCLVGVKSSLQPDFFSVYAWKASLLRACGRQLCGSEDGANEAQAKNLSPSVGRQ